MFRNFVTALSCHLLLLSAMDAAAQQSSPNPAMDPLAIKETVYDFGKIPQGKPVTHVFEVRNAGTTDLVIENIQASCGCTTPEWNREPIRPGASSRITVGYNAVSEGSFEKSIAIYYDKGKVKNIYVKGDVWKTPEVSAPKNQSVQILKNLN